MKVPFTANQSHQSANTKPVNCNANIRNNSLNQVSTNSTTANLCYEPKSVLEIRGSPSPGTDKPALKTEISAVCDDPIQLEDHVLNQFEDWDSFMKELGLHEDNISNFKPSGQLTQYEFQTPYATFPELSLNQSFDSAQFTPPEFALPDTSQFPILNHSNINPFDISNDFHHMNNNWNVGFDYVDELIRFAECFETHSFQLAHVILGRLNQRLRSASGKPVQRAAFYFKEALQALLTGSSRPLTPSSSDVIQTIKAQKAFSNISPIPMFASFTANQAALEAVDGLPLVHVIDFDIGFGGHWASFIKELADKAESRKATTPYLRITALVHEEYAVESKLIRENLSQFARELNLAFDIDFVLFRTFECLSFKAIKFMEGEKVVVLLSPAIFRRVGTGFLSDLRRVSPHVVVHVDSEGLMGSGTTSFRQTVVDGLDFYSTLLESLEAANACGIIGGGGGGGDWMRRIETFVLFPKITEAVEAAGRRVMPWREAFVAAGFRPVALSQFADCQADCLLRRVQVRGFHVAKRQAEMLLFWHERALVATSAWRC